LKSSAAGSTSSTTMNPKANETPGSDAKGEAKTLQPANKEFETLVKAPTEKTSEEAGKEKRGGFRSGAGRPMGCSDDMAEVNRLPEVPNSSIKILVELPFDLLSEINSMAEIKLKPEEAKALALSITRLSEYHWPGSTKGIMFEWLALGGLVTGITRSRLKMIKDKNAASKAARGGGPGSLPTSQVTLTPGEKKLTDMVQPAKGGYQT
jgi:hypothetical protein